MQLITAKLIADKAAEIDVDAELYERYSGRGMFGRETVGLVVGEQDAVMKLSLLVVADLDGLEKTKFIKDISSCKWDNMGKGFIYY